jgi:PAH dioxygenase small subunit
VSHQAPSVQRIVSPAEYQEITELLHLEAELLDVGDFDRWLGLLDENLSYRMPVTVTRESGQGTIYADDMEFMSETIHSIRMRLERMKTEYAWAEDPPSRTRHLITNIRVKAYGSSECAVTSYFCVYWSRGMSSASTLFVGFREDVLIRRSNGWRILKRDIFLDTSTVGANGITVLF